MVGETRELVSTELKRNPGHPMALLGLARRALSTPSTAELPPSQAGRGAPDGGGCWPWRQVRLLAGSDWSQGTDTRRHARLSGPSGTGLEGHRVTAPEARAEPIRFGCLS
jgi:hypothetical protein